MSVFWFICTFFLTTFVSCCGNLFSTEHKNMPIDDALGLVDRDFARYCQNVREGRIPPRRPVPTKDDVSQLLTKAASGEKLNQEQLHSVINALQKQKHNAPAGQPSSGMPSESGQSMNCGMPGPHFWGASRHQTIPGQIALCVRAYLRVPTVCPHIRM